MTPISPPGKIFNSEIKRGGGAEGGGDKYRFDIGDICIFYSSYDIIFRSIEKDIENNVETEQILLRLKVGRNRLNRQK